jgi:exonuclease VII large subunit
MGRFRIAILGLTATLLVTPVSAFEFPTLRQPAWHELSSQQREILAPLGSEWDRMDDARRKKWMGIAARYPHLTPEEQTRVQNQMGGWSKLSPQQKQAVREKYKALRQAPADKRQNLREQWERYQQLPPEEKQRLQEEAAQRKEEQKRAAREKSRQATSVLSAKVLKPGYPLAPIQQAPAPVINLAPTPVPEAAPVAPPEATAAPSATTPQP